jgi:hypothetical protein
LSICPRFFVSLSPSASTVFMFADNFLDLLLVICSFSRRFNSCHAVFSSELPIASLLLWSLGFFIQSPHFIRSSFSSISIFLHPSPYFFSFRYFRECTFEFLVSCPNPSLLFSVLPKLSLSTSSFLHSLLTSFVRSFLHFSQLSLTVPSCLHL